MKKTLLLVLLAFIGFGLYIALHWKEDFEPIWFPDRYECLGHIDCMPGFPSRRQIKYCAPQYEEWARTHCSNQPEKTY
jgi:hypothetical protein